MSSRYYMARQITGLEIDWFFYFILLIRYILNLTNNLNLANYLGIDNKYQVSQIVNLGSTWE
ncbi:MAG: hypothetical protein AAF208_08210 [Cyanobacteria bacterium P01_A01_bin.45]